MIPARAASAVYNDFTVEGSANTLVDAQIAVTFDYVGTIEGGAVYRDRLSLSLEVEDLTNGQPVGTLSLISQERNGDQGFTGVAVSAEIVPVADGSDGFIVKLRRGHSYRVSFVLSADNFAIGLAKAKAQWSTLVVSIDEDDQACETVSEQRKTQGCNGQDDDCDQEIDECDEDIFGPDVHIDPSVKQGWFQSTADAIAAVNCAVHAVDDCQTVAVADASLTGSCDSVSASVTATDACGNQTVKSVWIKVDDEAPVTTCAVAIDDLWPPNHKMVDVGFTFTATDSCGEPDVVVTVTSDEPTISASGSGQTSRAPDAEILKTLDGVVHGVRLRAERSTDGNGRNGRNGRVYEITVTATDAAGNSHQSSCQVGVRRSGGMGPPVDDGQFHDATCIN